MRVRSLSLGKPIQLRFVDLFRSQINTGLQVIKRSSSCFSNNIRGRIIEKRYHSGQRQVFMLGYDFITVRGGGNSKTATRSFMSQAAFGISRKFFIVPRRQIFSKRVRVGRYQAIQPLSSYIQLHHQFVAEWIYVYGVLHSTITFHGKTMACWRSLLVETNSHPSPFFCSTSGS